jgi:hypothetical protein
MIVVIKVRFSQIMKIIRVPEIIYFREAREFWLRVKRFVQPKRCILFTKARQSTPTTTNFHPLNYTHCPGYSLK